MKFHCDRCKTKYSISDDRVRGRILKIRCKKCSEIITVREPGAAGSNGLAEGEKPAETRSPESVKASKANQSQPPATLQEEWYVSEDGRQEGPFDLATARKWVATRTGDDSGLFCWSEGFDDWQPIVNISQLRDQPPKLRRKNSRESGVRSNVEGRGGGTQKPSFAATMAALSSEKVRGRPSEKNQGASLSKHSQSLSSSVQNSARRDPSLSFDIGEASRIVDLATLLGKGNNHSLSSLGGALATPAAATPPGGSNLDGQAIQPGILPAVGEGTGDFVGAGEMSSTSPLSEGIASERSRNGLLTPVLLFSAIIIAAAGVALIAKLVNNDGTLRLTRGQVGGSDNLAYSTSGVSGGKKERAEGTPTSGNSSSQKSKVSRRNNDRKRNPVGTISGTKLEVSTGGGEVDLSGLQTAAGGGPLNGEDLMRTYRKNQVGLTMCYERSLKKNPLLKVPKTWVDVTVSLQGTVTNVKVNSMKNTELGKCLASRIGRWKFRKTTEVFSGRFPVVFGQ